MDGVDDAEEEATDDAISTEKWAVATDERVGLRLELGWPGP